MVLMTKSLKDINRLVYPKLLIFFNKLVMLPTKVFEYIDKEDSPKPVTYQLDLLRKVGFRHIDLLHKNSCFAAFGAVKIDYHPDSGRHK